jgi:acyl-coenzyme A thioesterase PaaI-like protein
VALARIGGGQPAKASTGWGRTICRAGRLTTQLPVKPHLLAPNGYLNAGSVISLAGTAAGAACMANLPESN